MQDVARQAGVSTTTVSHVLNGTRRVRDEVSDRVMAAVTALRYQPDEMARALRRQDTETIGLLVPNLTTPLPSALLHDLELIVEGAGLGMIVASSRNVPAREDRWLRTFWAKKVSTVIVWPIHNTSGVLANLVELGQPLIQIVSMVPGVAAPALVANFEAAGRMGLEHLVAHGHRRIVAVSGQSSYHRRAVRGAQDAVAGAVDSVHVDTVFVGYEPRAEVGTVQAVLRRNPRPSAILALSAQAIEATVLALRQDGLMMGTDVAVVALADRDWLDYLSPPVTTIRHDSRGIAGMAVDLLSRSLGGERLHPYQVTFEPTLHGGQSCGCPRPIALDPTTP
jgi:LacI family transcriptional regulator